MRAVLMIGIVWALALASPLAFGQSTWLVSNDPGEPRDFGSLAEALAHPSVLPDDIIEISEGSGPYIMATTVTKRVTIRAQENEQPVIQPSGVLRDCFRT